MKRFLALLIPVAVALLLGGAASAQGPMGPGMMGPGMWGGWQGQYGCPGWGMMGPMMGPGMMGPAMMGPGMGPGMMGPGWTPPQTQLTDEKAKELAQQYADTYLKGFTVDKVLPITGMGMAMYSVELKGPQGEIRTFHVNPWGAVMPFGGPWRRAG